MELEGGARFLSPERVARLDCLMVTCNERRLQLETAPRALSHESWVLAGFGLVVGAFLGGWAMWQLRGMF